MNAIYCRVSTDEQVRKGYSLEDQIQACRQHLSKLGIAQIKEYIDDGYSGEYLERPGLEQLRADIASGKIECIAVYDPDRLSRNLTNQLILAEEIEKAGVRLTFVTGDYDCSPEGRLFFSLKGAIAAYEKAKIRERTYRGRRAKAAKGKIVSNAHPFGYDWDKKNSMYIINEQEAIVIKTIYKLCIDNGLGARAIALELARSGIVGRNKRPLSISTITRILSREMYFGKHYLFKQSVRKTGQNTREITNNPRELWIPVNIPPIISKETWEKARQQIKMNKHLSKRNTKYEYLLKGILFCGVCGRRMTAYSRKGPRKNGPDKTYYYYSCIYNESNSYLYRNNRCCSRRIPAKALDTLVWENLTNLIINDQYLLNYTNSQYTKTSELDNLYASDCALRKKQADLTNWYRLNLLDSQVVNAELQTISEERNNIAIKISNLLEQKKRNQSKYSTPNDFFNIMTIEQKQKTLQMLPYQIKAVRIKDDFIFWLEER